MHNRIIRSVGKAIHDFQLIADGDNLLLGMSGGKDSYTMLDILLHLQKKAPVRFALTAITIDSGFDNFRWEAIKEHLQTIRGKSGMKPGGRSF